MQRCDEDGSVDCDSVDTVAEGRRPHRFSSAVPTALEGWLLDLDWDRSKLWDIEGPVSSCALDELAWHFELPWWRGPAPDAWFVVRPVEVFEAPDDHPEHRSRIQEADLSYPIHVIQRHGRIVILDGIHRAARAYLRGVAAMDVIRLGPEQLAAICI